MQNPQLVLFILAALIAGGLAMGGVTFVYFLDKWRQDPPKRSDISPQDHANSSPF